MTTNSSTQGRAVDHDAIAHRAYELYLARGCDDGCDVEDWLEAEAQLLRAETSSTEQPMAKGKGRSTGPAKGGDPS